LADLAAPSVLEELSALSIVRGLRTNTGETTVLDANLDAMAILGFRLDAVVPEGGSLGRVATIARRHPELLIALNHLGRPNLDLPREKWEGELSALRPYGNVYVKYSGLGNLPGFRHHIQARPYFEFMLQTLGVERIMWGSDWPVSTETGGTAPLLHSVRLFRDVLSSADMDRVLSGTAIEFYGISPLEK